MMISRLPLFPLFPLLSFLAYDNTIIKELLRQRASDSANAINFFIFFHSHQVVIHSRTLLVAGVFR